MSEVNFLYPATPVNVPSFVTQPSAAFRKEVTGVMGSIVLFLVVYLLMFLLSIGLVIGCVYAGISLIIALPKAITLLAGLGLIGLGIMVFVFLIKFLFAVSRFDHSGSIEITAAEQPRLFAFIRQLTRDTQTPFPKKIYLSPDVNACVFYHSSFWSMFLPVKKNLQIGLGLVNSVNISEFKAVMAHEFGHFSQRSMKLGSFVYNVNKIIYNMLFDNKGYSGALSSWAGVDGIFAFFANLTAKIAQGIQWVLQQMYGVINKSYMRLSREMEFHADAVAASVSGSKSLVTALRRIELADTGYNIALQKCDDLFKQKKISPNIYHNQRVVLKHMAEEFKLPVQHELPVVSREFTESNNLSRVNFKDQWASHPSTEDREQHLDALSVDAEVLQEPAWVLFDNPEQLQSRLTQKVYESAVAGQEVITISSHEFEEKFYGDIKRFSLPEAYNGFYDNRQVPVLDAGQLEAVQRSGVASFEEIFSLQHAVLPKKIRAAAADIGLLKAIAEKSVYAKSFDFDGIKYAQQEAAAVAEKLEKEKQQQEQELEQLDKAAIGFFMEKAREKGAADELKNRYTDYFEQRRKADEFLRQVNTMLESLGPIYSGQTIPVSEINSMISTLKSVHEIQFKGWLKRWLALGVFDQEAEEKKQIEKFADSNYVYFSGTSFFEGELGELNRLCNASWSSVNTFLFGKFKSILAAQLQLAGQ
jgi:Zn-dependent protease with chaperone function